MVDRFRTRVGHTACVPREHLGGRHSSSGTSWGTGAMQSARSAICAIQLRHSWLQSKPDSPSSAGPRCNVRAMRSASEGVVAHRDTSAGGKTHILDAGLGPVPEASLQHAPWCWSNVCALYASWLRCPWWCAPCWCGAPFEHPCLHHAKASRPSREGGRKNDPWFVLALPAQSGQSSSRMFRSEF